MNNSIHTNPFAEVTTMPLLNARGEISSRQSVILDPEGAHEEVGVVSREYQLVPNRKVQEIALDILSRSQLNFEEDSLLFDGKHYRQRWVLPDLSIEPSPGDVVRLALDIVNSYDGTKRVSVSFNAQRLVCSNGMMLDYFLGGVRFRHIGDRDFESELQSAADSIHQVQDRLTHLLPAFQQMINTPVDVPFLQRTYSELKLSNSLVAGSLLNLESDEQHRWGLYNSITDILSRQESMHAENINRQVTRWFFSQN